MSDKEIVDPKLLDKEITFHYSKCYDGKYHNNETPLIKHVIPAQYWPHSKVINWPEREEWRCAFCDNFIDDYMANQIELEKFLKDIENR